MVYSKGTSLDAETLMIDPQDGDLYLITKSHMGRPQSTGRRHRLRWGGAPSSTWLPWISAEGSCVVAASPLQAISRQTAHWS